MISKLGMSKYKYVSRFVKVKFMYGTIDCLRPTNEIEITFTEL